MYIPASKLPKNVGNSICMCISFDKLSDWNARAQSDDRFHARFPFLAPSRCLAQLQHRITLLSIEAAEKYCAEFIKQVYCYWLNTQVFLLKQCHLKPNQLVALVEHRLCQHLLANFYKIPAWFLHHTVSWVQKIFLSSTTWLDSLANISRVLSAISMLPARCTSFRKAFGSVVTNMSTLEEWM